MFNRNKKNKVKSKLGGKSKLNDHSKHLVILVGVLALLFLIAYAIVLILVDGTTWYTAILGSAFTSFMMAFIVMIIQNRFKQKLFERDNFYQTLKEHGIQALHFSKKESIIEWLRQARREIYITGYRLIMTSDIVESIIEALKRSPELKIRFLTCPPWNETYKKIFDDDSRHCYINIIKKIRDSIPNCENRVQFRCTGKPLFNDTYIVDDKLITSPYVHNRVRVDNANNVITADKFFSLEVSSMSSLFDFFKEDFLAVWESPQTKELFIKNCDAAELVESQYE